MGVIRKAILSLRIDRVREKRLLFALLGLFLFGLLLVLGIDATVRAGGSRYIENAEAVPPADAIMVLGARVFADGGVSDMLHDRLEVALQLYRQGKAPKLLVSGDHGRPDYDEVDTMRRYLTDRGVPEQDIFMDHAGFSTYESMYRAKAVFQVHTLIVVTQHYHLMRAVYNARVLGMEAYGVTSDLQSYRGISKFMLREMAARNKDFWLVRVLRPKPTYLGPVIPIKGDGRATDDK